MVRMKRALSKIPTPVRIWCGLFIACSAMIWSLQTLNHYFPIIPIEPINWPIAAPYGALLFALAIKLRKNIFALSGALIVLSGWVINTQLFFPIDGGESKGYELTSSIILYLTESAGLAIALLVSRWFYRCSRTLYRLLFATLIMAVFGAAVSLLVEPGKWTFIVNSDKHYWWMFSSNLVFIGLITAGWMKTDAPKKEQESRVAPHFQEKEAA